MNIFEIREQTGIALPALKKLDDIGALDCEPVYPIVEKIYANLGKGVPLTVAQLLKLIENPQWLQSLGKHQNDAQFEIDELGDCVGEAAPKEVYCHLIDAVYNDQKAIEKIVAWIKSIIPAHYAVRHSYIATRFILGSASPIVRASLHAKIRRAFRNCRKHPDFAGWWTVKQHHGRDVTWYSRPQIPYDL